MHATHHETSENMPAPLQQETKTAMNKMYREEVDVLVIAHHKQTKANNIEY